MQPPLSIVHEEYLLYWSADHTRGHGEAANYHTSNRTYTMDQFNGGNAKEEWYATKLPGPEGSQSLYTERTLSVTYDWGHCNMAWQSHCSRCAVRLLACQAWWSIFTSYHISYRFGRYQWLRMPFSILSVPEVIQRIIHELIEGLKDVEVIANDFVVIGFGDTMEEAAVGEFWRVVT